MLKIKPISFELAEDGGILIRDAAGHVIELAPPGADEILGEVDLIPAWIAKPSGQEYVDRGDPEDMDWTHLDLTIDNAWHDLDLSSIVTDVTANLVSFYWYVRDATPGLAFFLRQNGNVFDRNISVITSQIPNVYNYSNTWIGCDENQVIEYKVHTGMEKLGLNIRGWFM